MLRLSWPPEPSAVKLAWASTPDPWGPRGVLPVVVHVKVTTPADLAVARALLAQSSEASREATRG